MLAPAENLRPLENLILPVCAAHGVDLVLVRQTSSAGRHVLQVMIDLPDPSKAPSAQGVDVRDLAVETETSEPSSEPKSALASANVGQVGSVTLQHCSRVSRDISTLLDVQEVPGLPEKYSLEVTSPGLERPLVRAEDYVRFAGREAHIATGLVLSFQGLSDRRQFTGILRGFEAGQICMEVDGQEVAIPLEQVQKAHLVYRFKEVQRPGHAGLKKKNTGANKNRRTGT